jgi:tetratricopeptide (TPR) repeat protein
VPRRAQVRFRIAFVGALALLLLLRGPALMSYLLSSVGLVSLARDLSGAAGELFPQVALDADTLLCQALSLDAGNRAAHRGLGWALAAQGKVAKAAAEWRAGGFTAQEFIDAGEQARRAGRFQEAFEWYERAANVEPGWGDPWHCMGLLYWRTQDWKSALDAYEEAVELDTLTNVGRGSLYYRIGVIYQSKLEPRQTDAALMAYGAAIETGDFGDNEEAADCHYRRGQILSWMGGDPDEYIREYKRAIELDPRHVSAHILLGAAYYVRYHDVEMAEAEIRRAMELSPYNKWTYYHLGDIYRYEGQAEDAAVMYERALDIDPEFALAQKRLRAVHEGNK